MNLTQTKISTRLAAGFGTLAVLMALLCGVALYYLQAISLHFENVMGDRYPKVQIAGEIKAVNNEVSLALRNLFVMSDPDDMQAQYDLIAGSGKRTSANIDKLTATIASPEGRQVLEQMKAARAAYRAPRDKVVALLKSGRSEEAKNALLLDVRPLQVAYMAQVDALIKLQEQKMTEASGSVNRTLAQGRAMLVALLAAAFAMAAATAAWIIRSVTRPLSEAMMIARGVAGGDLAMEFAAHGRNETGLLLGALHDMKTRLALIVGDVRGNAEGVATASAQISQGNNDLSARTEQQASALQVTAASMVQLSATVRQNADSASQADQLARGASTFAVRGGEVVGLVVHTMRSINDSSKKVADIIGVIDGIAFQTNILALNAAVEAARAGEQGRGFAVVAAEVRSLAQRSAEAAKEIKSLIAANVERVEQGSVQVDQAGETMRQVVASIQRVTDIVAEISAASSEQSNGVAQIGEAVSQMDRSTQQNAALVEESAAAAESLLGQANQLVGAVAVFKLQATAH